jgi:hypothetical protein
LMSITSMLTRVSCIRACRLHHHQRHFHSHKLNLKEPPPSNWFASTIMNAIREQFCETEWNRFCVQGILPRESLRSMQICSKTSDYRYPDE